jgi:para-aminobenzoate synthetase/4-amino-4-deoxychorismate lyase
MRPSNTYVPSANAPIASGKLYTPPLSCGLLPGVFRAQLLEAGQVKERIVRLEELEDCTKIFLVNSVRKWQRVTLENN